MALELVYTSAARGLRAGTSGFCTVAMTKGMPPALVPPSKRAPPPAAAAPAAAPAADPAAAIDPFFG